MGCSDNTCGIGGWGGPLPGDPDNNSILSASPAFGGIDITWSYPSTNPQAVAYVNLYRGITSAFDSAILLAQVGGNTYYDKLDNNNQYYYWISVVSVNGTVGALIGPATATARPTIEQTIEQLTGLIDAGVLSQSLRTEIDKITLNYAELTDEIANRISANAALSQALSNVQQGLEQSLAFVNQEIITRRDGDSALATQLNTVAALNASNVAAILSEQTARVTADSALASQIVSVNAATASNSAAALLTEQDARTSADSALANQITTAQSTLNGNIASVQTTLDTKITTVGNKVTSIGALYTAKLNVNGLVGGFGVYNDGTSVEAGFDVDRFYIGRTNSDKRKPFIVEGSGVFIDQAVINKLTFSKLRSDDGAVIVENGKLKTAYIDTRGLVIRDAAGNAIFGAGTPLAISQISGLGALATQSDVRIGSTVKFPDGSTLNAADFVNRLSKIGTGNISTFIADGAIGTAQIGNAAIQNAQIGNEITSSGFSSGSTGWSIRKDGYAEFNNIVIRRNTLIASGSLVRSDFIAGGYTVPTEKGANSYVAYPVGTFLRGPTFYIETGFTDFDAVTNVYSPAFYARIESPSNGYIVPGGLTGNVYDLAFDVSAAPARTWAITGSGTAGQRVVLTVTPIIKILQTFVTVTINNYNWALFRQR